MAKATKVKLSVLIKNKDGKKQAKEIEMPIAQAENIFKDPKRDKSWKLADDKFTLKNGYITSK